MKLLTTVGLLPALLSLQLTSLSLVAADDGLQIDVTRPAACNRKTKKGDLLKVNYRGTLQTTGAEFDSSYGKDPFKFTLGVGQVISGWDKGLMDMCPGEERKLTIPPSLGYGSQDLGVIPPNSVLSK
jgi:FKBP-type peptidyl-prolyl cis-trans isomerase